MRPVAVEQREIGGKDGSHDQLALRADIPKFHFKGKGDAKRCDQQGNADLYGGLNRNFAAEAAADHLRIDAQRIVPQHQDKQRARDDCKEKRSHAEQGGLQGR